MKAINAYSKTSYREQPTLFLEFHGTQGGVEEQAKMAQDIARENGGMDFEWTTKPEDRTPPLDGAPPGLFRLPAAAARLARRFDRRMRSDFTAHRVHRRNLEGHLPRLDADTAFRAMSATATSTARF